MNAFVLAFTFGLCVGSGVWAQVLPASCDCRLQTDPPGAFPGWMSQAGCERSCQCRMPRTPTPGCCQFGYWNDFQVNSPAPSPSPTRLRSMRYSMCDSNSQSFCNRYAYGQQNACFYANRQTIARHPHLLSTCSFGPRGFIYIQCCQGYRCTRPIWQQQPWRQCQRRRFYHGNYFCDRQPYRPGQGCLGSGNGCGQQDYWTRMSSQCQPLDVGAIELSTLPIYQQTPQPQPYGGCPNSGYGNNQCSVDRRSNACYLNDCYFYGPQCGGAQAAYGGK